MNIVKVESCEEESAQVWLPSVKLEPEDPLAASGEGSESWGCNWNTTYSSLTSTETKIECCLQDPPLKTILVKEETNIEIKIEDHDVKPLSDCGNLEESVTESPKSTRGDSEEEYSYVKMRSIKCKYCHKDFNKAHELQEHLRTHSKVKPYKCELCDKTFSRNAYLVRHARMHSGERPFKCLYCGKAYTDDRYLKTHVRIHTEEKPYKCGFCGKCYLEQRSLAGHILSHTKTNSFKCRYCDLSFTNRDKLYGHAISHYEGQSFTCETCEKAFNLRAFLARHKLTHTWDTVKCESCDGCFKQLADMRDHLHFHTGKEEFSCDSCDIKFREEIQLILHKEEHKPEKAVHRDIVSNTNSLVHRKEEMTDAEIV